MNKVRHFVEQSWLLIVASFFFGLLLAATNYALSGEIKKREMEKLNEKAGALLPEGAHFKELEEKIVIKSSRGKEQEITGYKAKLNDECVGWVFNVRGPGFADIIKLVVVVDKDFEKLAGYGVLMSNETPNIGDKIKDDEFLGQFKGTPIGDFKLTTTGNRETIDLEIVAISGATISSEAVVSIMNDSLGQIKEQMKKKGLI